ncbi:amyloid-beta A4 precursor protein-binding family B member 3 isoform X2 [Ascaphus truei]
MYSSSLTHSLGTIQEKKLHRASVSELSPALPFPGPAAAADRRHSLPWHDEDLFHNINEPGTKNFAVHCLGWVEIPEEDLAPGKSSITVNNCIQQLSHTKCDGTDITGPSNEGQNMVMVLKKDTMSLLDPLDHSLIHSQPIINIRVWGVGCNNGRDFAFVANDKDTCMLKCHVFRCDVPAKAIASVLHDMCSKIMAERAVANNTITRSVTLETISPENLPQQVGILDAVQQSVQKYEVIYVGSLSVSKPMGMDVLNETIENVTINTQKEQWKPAVIDVTDTLVTVHQKDGGEEEEEDPIWQCEVRFVTFMGIGKDPHTFALIVDVGKQRFQSTVFWCEPDAGNVSEAVQAACMVQYQKCLVASSSRVRTKAPGKSLLKMKRTTSVDSPISPFTSSGHSLQKGTGASKRRGVMAFFEAFKQKHVMHTP